MKIFTQKTKNPATLSVALSYDERKRSRLKIMLSNGDEAGIVLARGEHLHHGDKLIDKETGIVVEIQSAPEALIEALANTPILFARAAYHLGNRHIPVQIIPEPQGGRLLFQTDHVLADMVKGLGCEVTQTMEGFEPEHGAYSGGHHHHGHDHDHEHEGDDHHHHHDDQDHLHDPGHGPHRSVPKIHQFNSQ